MVPRKVRKQPRLGRSEQNSARPEPSILSELSNETTAELEAKKIIAEVVEELSEDELKERQRLEQKVERAFFEAGLALRELRDKKLYRNTHKTFEAYCQQRFGYKRARSYQLIDAAIVFENLSTSSSEADTQQNREILSTISRQNSFSENEQQHIALSTRILPTKETQVRPLAKLEPEVQRKVWQQAVEQADGKVPTERLVRSIVERLKEKPLPQIPLSFKRNDAFILHGLPGPERCYNGCWAITREILQFSLIVETHNGKLQVRPENLDPIEDRAVRRQIAALLKRIQKLRKLELDRGAIAVLEILGKQTFLTEVEERLLKVLEDYYGIV